jgi:protein involved in polysaccharide export with SLBB domain
MAQDVSPELMREAVSKTGLTENELLEKLDSKETLEQAEPGRVEPLSPVVVLPSESIDKAALASPAPKTPPKTIPANYFGADFFKGDPSLFNPSSFGPVPGDYLIGSGDQIVVDVWGEVEFRHERLVDRDGSIILPRAGRISCVNSTLDQVTRDIRNKLSKSYSGIDAKGEGGTTFVSVSLGALRAIRVFVVGEVAMPGAYEMTSLSTIFTALHSAGGPGENGSMRDIKLMRGKEKVGSIDLYEYLLTGSRDGDEILRDGDTVFVPGRKISVQINGQVRRPLKYELLPKEGLRKLIEYAGGFTPDAETNIVHVNRILSPNQRSSYSPDRVQRDLDLRQKKIHLINDGDVVTVDSIPDRLENWVEIEGSVKRPGRYELTHTKTVKNLINIAGGLWGDAITEHVTIDRIEADGTYKTVEISLGGDSGAFPLQGQDILKVFSIWDLQDRYQVSIDGAVREPGSFDFREGMTLRDLVLRAGGLSEDADVLHAEVSRLSVDALSSRDLSSEPAKTVELIDVELGRDWLSDGPDFVIHPRDQVAIRRMPWWQLQRSVIINGEVGYPGTYVLDRPDERLSDLISRAGGLKPNAFAKGARVVRKKDGIGNVALSLDKAIDNPGKDNDIVLAAGDEIIIPPTPHTVKVAGAVSFPTSIVWEKGKSLGDYVSRAGGYIDGADKWKTHVVYPNGMSKQIRHRWFDPGVMPGSVIVVPTQKPDNGDSKLSTLKEIASIFASIATVWLVIDRTQ